ncbi:MAG: LysM peptidoglycan-binding domain-containing protein [Anaerolineales bacterium]|nr:LysM peptidoglycan-binding domain-containing protein [Anaerolineales bacterium]MDW8227784.1 LysM peptidoglycan-binding domain-containing protein [Anaerolineales bacterium]
MFLVERKSLLFLALVAVSLSACTTKVDARPPAAFTLQPTPVLTPSAFPTRPAYAPGELVDYIAHSGDTLPGLAARFNTTVEEIRAANPHIPADATTMPPGMPMRIPIYYRPFWGDPFQILPDSLFVNGPAQVGFDIETFVQNRPGWLKEYRAYAQGASRSGAEIVQLIATNYSISPRLLLAILEYRSGALSNISPPDSRYPLGIYDPNYADLYMQLVWIANRLNHGFYGWRTGDLIEFELANGKLERPDPWQTAATVAIQFLFSQLEDHAGYQAAIGPNGISRVYQTLFGDPWTQDIPHIPVSLQQPPLTLPFRVGESWTLTGGPHTGWGHMWPWAALDFAPPGVESGCVPTDRPAVAMADGLVVRSETGVVVLDLDGDGDERTGWNLIYLHLATQGRAPLGAQLKTGDPVGYPSCEGGTATGSHVHVARKYNGEWIPADGVIPFNLEGWIAYNGKNAYEGGLIRNGQRVIASERSILASQITAGK